MLELLATVLIEIDPRMLDLRVRRIFPVVDLLVCGFGNHIRWEEIEFRRRFCFQVIKIRKEEKKESRVIITHANTHELSPPTRSNDIYRRETKRATGRDEWPMSYLSDEDEIFSSSPFFPRSHSFYVNATMSTTMDQVVKKAKDSFGQMFDKSLHDLVRGIRNHKDNEVRTEVARFGNRIRMLL